MAQIHLTDTDSVRLYAGATGIGGTTTSGEVWADWVNSVIPTVSTGLELWTGILLEKLERVWVPVRTRRAQRSIMLPATPVDTGETFEIKTAEDRDFATATAWDADEHYLDTATGILHFDRCLSGKPGTLQITYTGGLGANRDEVKATDLGRILELAANMWIRELYARRANASKKSDSKRGTASTWVGPIGSPPDAVQKLLSPHRRRRIGA